MKSKKWVINFMIFFFVIYFMVVFIYYIVNPYQIFNHSITKQKFFYSQNEYPVKLFDKLKTKKYSLLFGTSRSQRIKNDGSKIDILNFASLYGNSLSVLNFLEQLNSKQLKNINKIYYLVDDHCLNGYDNKDEHSHYVNINFHRSKYLYKVKNLLEINIDKINKTIKDLQYNWFIPNTYKLIENGSMERMNYLEKYKVPVAYKKKSTRQYYEKDGLEALIKINQFCIKHNLKIYYFTPTHFAKYDKLMNANIIYAKWSYLLSHGINAFYALWYIDGISNLIIDNYYVAFSDKHSHLNTFYVNKVFRDNIVMESEKYKITSIDKLSDYLKNNKQYYSSK